ncbi:MAG: hypothetical protein R3248_10510 [Candidatus Promineifilaceae bacterium]|nr:hypothetical protein [Candidatus Promineifilaceae bacterium]
MMNHLLQESVCIFQRKGTGVDECQEDANGAGYREILLSGKPARGQIVGEKYESTCPGNGQAFGFTGVELLPQCGSQGFFLDRRHENSEPAPVTRGYESSLLSNSQLIYHGRGRGRAFSQRYLQQLRPAHVREVTEERSVEKGIGHGMVSFQ